MYPFFLALFTFRLHSRRPRYCQPRGKLLIVEIEQHGSFSIHLVLFYADVEKRCRSACSHEECAQRAYGHDTMAAAKGFACVCFTPFIKVLFSPFFSPGVLPAGFEEKRGVTFCHLRLPPGSPRPRGPPAHICSGSVAPSTKHSTHHEH